MAIGEILRIAPVIPVLTVSGPRDAVPIARALVEGGLPAIEITLRTAGAMDAVRAILSEVKGALPGVGTVLHPAQLAEARRAGAIFAVSPGATDRLLDAAAERGIAWLPGASTASEAMALAERGHSHVKFFPAAACGGPAFLRAVAQPLPDTMFCPTGGIDAASAPAYLALPNVLCVGGSWVAPGPSVRDRDWGRIRALARQAAGMKTDGDVID